MNLHAYSQIPTWLSFWKNGAMKIWSEESHDQQIVNGELPFELISYYDTWQILWNFQQWDTFTTFDFPPLGHQYLFIYNILIGLKISWVKLTQLKEGSKIYLSTFSFLEWSYPGLVLSHFPWAHTYWKQIGKKNPDIVNIRTKVTALQKPKMSHDQENTSEFYKKIL
jgi:hypothetical protein